VDRVAFRVGVVLVAALLTGPALAQTDRQAPADNAMQQLENGTSGGQSTGQTFDGGAGPSDAYPNGSDDGSVVNPDGDDSSADAPDDNGGDDQDSGGPGGDDQGPPPTDPA